MLKKLSGLDATFLYLETGRSFGHVSSVMLFDRPDEPDFDLVATYRSRIERALPAIEPLRRRLVEVPFGLDHPYWANDPSFDLDYHVRHVAVPPPGGREELCALVARIIGRPLDRTRPLWEVYLIEGLDDGGFAVLTKVHHATIDGVAGAEMLMMILDHPSTPADEIGPDTWSADEIPGPAEMMGRAWWDLVRRPEKVARVAIRTARDVPRLVHTDQFVESTIGLRRRLPDPIGSTFSRLIGAPHPGDPDADADADAHDDAHDDHDRSSVPRTPFNAHITPNRRFAYRSMPFTAVRELKAALGVTINDVVMAVCAGALRTYLDGHGELPDEPLRAMVPVSIRTFTEDDPWTNRVSSIFVQLPTNVEEPADRVAAVHEAMGDAKHRFELLPADLIIDLASAVPGALAVQAARIVTNPRVADHTPLPSNVVISNVPGPREPLYLGAARLRHYIPVSTVIDGQGLNITVQSYDDVIDLGLVSCRELVPDLEDLADLHVAELDRLREGAGLPPMEAMAS